MSTRLARGVALLAAGAALALASTPLRAQAPGAAEPPEERFRAASALVRSGDALGGIAIYRGLAEAGYESGSLYWNWAQAAAARGEAGEAIWAVLRGRELDPGDPALGRELERLREAANLDPAELAPEPMAALARQGRQLHLAWLALGLALLSLAAHAVARLRPANGWAARAAGLAGACAVLAAAAPLAGATARPTAVVVRRGAPLLDGASGSARAIGALRQGEVVPVIERGSDYLRVEDSSGARGWVHRDDAWGISAKPSARSR